MPHFSATQSGTTLPSVGRQAGGFARLPAEIRRQVTDWRHARRRDAQMRQMRSTLGTSSEHDRFRELAFMFAVVALAAKLSLLGSREKEEAIEAFCRVFPWSGQDSESIGQLFDSAREDTADAVVYARRIVALCPPALHRQRLEVTFARLAKAITPQGEMPDSQRALLYRIGEAFGLKRRSLPKLLRRQKDNAPVSPYAVLQVKRGWNDRQIRQTYLQLVRECHPDAVQARGGNPNARQAASDRLALLNDAYAVICRERGMKG